MDGTVEIRKVASEGEYQQALAIRQRVFVEEQGVPAELEVDAYEREATFFLATLAGRPIATGRFRRKGSLLKYERIATLPESRGTGVGSALMKVMQEHGASEHAAYLPYMHAQEEAVRFYERLGWQKLGDRFEEADIGHYVMILPPAEPGRLLCRTAPDTPPLVKAWLRTTGVV